MKQAPNFSLKDQNGATHELRDYHGRWLVLYFYPKDNTPGCTAEACNFRDSWEDMGSQVAVVGVSTDSVASHKQFAEKYHLKFTLLSDPDHKTVEAYGSWKPVRFMGKEFLGTHRNTFIIDPEGAVVQEYVGVDPRSHAKQIMGDLKKLQAIS